MNDEVEIIRDDKGMAVIGDPAAIESFLTSVGVTRSTDLGLSRIATSLSVGAAAAQSGAVIGATAGRWIHLSEASAAALAAGTPMAGSTTSLARTIVMQGGKTHDILEFTRGAGSLLTNPAVLAGAAGIMAQLAMKKSMDDIADYLQEIDVKVDDVLRAQKDEVIAGMIGAELEIDEAMILRDEVGRVSDVTWSKIQALSATLKTTQAYALRRLDALAESMEKRSKVGELADSFSAAESTVEEWLAVVARCFQLQDAMSVLELDRVLDSSPVELDHHRRGIRIARDKREATILQTTRRLLERMDAAAQSANAKVLLHPLAPHAVVRSGNEIARDVETFHEHMGFDADREDITERRWVEAAVDAKDRVLEVGSDGVNAASRIGTEGIATVTRVGEEGAAIAEKVGAEALSRASAMKARMASRLPRRD